MEHYRHLCLGQLSLTLAECNNYLQLQLVHVVAVVRVGRGVPHEAAGTRIQQGVDGLHTKGVIRVKTRKEVRTC